MPLNSYLRLALDNKRFLAFGLTMTFASSVGQTFFIGAFGPAVRGEFGLSHTSWGAIYMTGTLLSALVLPFTGGLIDRYAMRTYTTLVCTALVLAAAFMAAVPSAGFLVVAIFLLRQTGQGLASHTGTTAMARYFHADRGKAVALDVVADRALHLQVQERRALEGLQALHHGGPSVTGTRGSYQLV